MSVLLLTVATLFAGQMPDETAPPRAAVHEIPLLMEALDHADQSIRLSAVGDLEAHGTKATPALARAVAEGLPLHAVKAAVILRGIEPLDPRAVDLLSQIVLGNAESWRWSMAVDLLVAKAPTRMLSLLPSCNQALATDEPLRHAAVVRAAVVLGRDAGLLTQSLFELLHRPRQPLRHVLLERRVFTDNAVALTREAQTYDDLAILRALARCGAEPRIISEELLRRAGNSHPHVQLMVSRQARELGMAAPGNIIERLAELLDDSQPAIAIAAARELGEWGPAADSSTYGLAALLQSGHVDVRRAAAVALGRIGRNAAPSILALETALALEELVAAGARAEIEQALAAIKSAD